MLLFHIIIPSNEFYHDVLTPLPLPPPQKKPRRARESQQRASPQSVRGIIVCGLRGSRGGHGGLGV